MFQAFLGNVIRNLVGKYTSRYMVMVDMCRKRKGMQLSDFIFSDNSFCIEKVFISFARKSYDQVGTDIYLDPIRSFYISDFSENFSNFFAIVVAIHRL